MSYHVGLFGAIAFMAITIGIAYLLEKLGYDVPIVNVEKWQRKH